MIKEKEIIDKVKVFLQSSDRNTPLSINERSLQIFGNEKFLASPECKKILNKYKVPFHLLNAYETPEPFIYYLNRSNSKDVLIIENKDTWYSMRKVMIEEGLLCGFNFKALIYGEGRKIQSSFAYVNSDDMRELEDVNQFYYFGDIDSSGIDILYKLQIGYPEHSILPFEPGYEYLFKHRKLGRTKDLITPISITYKELSTLNFLGPTAIDELYYLCNHDYIIPQEILNYSVLKNWDIFEI